MTGPLAPYLHQPTPPRNRPAGVAQRATSVGHRAVTRSTRAVTQSVAAVADVMRSAKRPAVFTQGLMPSRLKRWWWKACDLAWDVVGGIAVLAAVVVLAFLAYMLATAALSAVFG